MRIAISYDNGVSVHKTGYGFNKLKLVKAIKEASGLGLKEAKDIVDSNDATNFFAIRPGAFNNELAMLNWFQNEMKDEIRDNVLAIRIKDQDPTLSIANEAVKKVTDCVLLSKKEYKELLRKAYMLEELKKSLSKICTVFMIEPAEEPIDPAALAPKNY